MKKVTVIFIFLFSIVALSKSQAETDRQPLITSIYGRFASIMVQVLRSSEAWTNEEKEALYYMLEASKYYTTKEGAGAPLVPHIPLNFSRDQSLFQVIENAPPRSAVIGSNLGDPIYVNLNVINRTESLLRISQIVQLLMHEFGHFVPKRFADQNYLQSRQAMIDSIAAKFGKRVETLEKQITLADGSIVRAMSASDILFGTIKTPTPTVDQFIAFNPFFFFIEKDGKVIDQTIPLLEQLESRHRFEVTKEGAKDYHRIYYWNIESLEQIKENDMARSWLKMRTTQIDLVMDVKKESITTDDFNDIHTQPDKTFSLHEFVVGINNRDKKIDRILSAQRYPSIKVDEQTKAKIFSEDQFNVVVRVQLDSATYRVGDEQHIRLILQNKDRNLAVQGTKISQNEYEFRITKPTVDFDFSIESVAVHDSMQVFFTEALRVTRIKQDIPKKNIKIKKMGINIDGKYQPLKAEMDIPTQTGTIEFIVESDGPVREIEIYESKSYRILNNEANADFMRASLRSDLKTPSVRTDFQVRTFDNATMIQEKISDGVYRVSIPYDFSLSPLNLNPKNALAEAIKRNPLEVFLNIQKYMEDAFKQPVSGTDLGVRAFYHLRLTNQNFEELTIYKNKPFYIRSGGQSPYRPIRRSCHSVFR